MYHWASNFHPKLFLQPCRAPCCHGGPARRRRRRHCGARAGRGLRRRRGVGVVSVINCRQGFNGLFKLYFLWVEGLGSVSEVKVHCHVKHGPTLRFFLQPERPQRAIRLGSYNWDGLLHDSCGLVPQASNVRILYAAPIFAPVRYDPLHPQSSYSPYELMSVFTL